MTQPTIEIAISSARPAEAKTDVLLLPCFAGPEPGAGVPEVASEFAVDLMEVLRRRRYAGQVGDIFEMESLGRLPARTVVFIGLGNRAEARSQTIMSAAMKLAARVGGRITTTLPSALQQTPDAGGNTEVTRAFVEGLLLGAYRFDRYKHVRGDSRPDRAPVIEQVTIMTTASTRDQVAAGVRRGEVRARAANWARDLVNTPAGDATPADVADEARRMAADHDLMCKVWERSDLVRGGFGGILGVGQGSINEPRLVELVYRGGGQERPIGLAGKGITFDSGGLSLKPSHDMEWMKCDMAGAAAMMAVVQGAAELGLAVNLHAVLPFAENLPGGSALRPGDVLTHRGGRTSEVIDTDSEGRLVLADALAYLAEQNPIAIIDAATLTDAAGLGELFWAALGNDSRLTSELLAAGNEVGDGGWELPLSLAYKHYFESPVADLRNTPSDVPDTTVMASIYLSEFVGGTPWVHIDNGSTAYLERKTELWPKGATGSPARALLAWIEKRTSQGDRADQADAEPPRSRAGGSS